jgi:hypothetical protein
MLEGAGGYFTPKAVGLLAVVSLITIFWSLLLSPPSPCCLLVSCRLLQLSIKPLFAQVRTGHKTTNVPLLTRMGDRFSTWSSGNGLRSVIPTLLTSGLLGYPFCLPDMVGGNAYFGRKPGEKRALGLIVWFSTHKLISGSVVAADIKNSSRTPSFACQNNRGNSSFGRKAGWKQSFVALVLKQGAPLVKDG